MKKVKKRDNPTDEEVLNLNSWVPNNEQKLELVNHVKDNVLNCSVGDVASKSNYICIDLDLERAIGYKATKMYTYLLNKYKYYLETAQLNKYGEFYCTVAEVNRDLNLTRYEQECAVYDLEEQRLIMYRNIATKGSKTPVRHFTINLDFSILDKLKVDSYNSRYGTNYPYRIKSKESGIVINVDFNKQAQ